MNEDDREFSPSSLWNQVSKVHVKLAEETDTFGSRGGDSDAPHESPHLYKKLISAQGLWMVLALVLLLALGMWSLTTYYIMIFNGLLCIRILFAPANGNPVWWQRLNWVVYAGLVVLLSILATQFLRFVA